MNNLHISSALKEVWDWKEESHQEVAHLPAHDALAKLLRDASHRADALGLKLEPLSEPQRALRVAERNTVYRIKRDAR